MALSFLDKARPVARATTPVAPTATPTATPVATPAIASAPVAPTPTAQPLSFESKARFVTPPAPEKPDDGSFLGGLVRAPLTILARPIQAVAEIGGASSDTVDRVTKKLTGGLVAPVPQNGADVEKDVGRGIQTAAFGLGPVAGGAAFGAGNSLEQGNDLLSTQTALQTALGAGAGKVLDLVGKPLLDATGNAVGKITPPIIKDIASKGTSAILDFAANHNIFPEGVSGLINDAATGAEKLANKPFDLAGNAVKKTFTKSPQAIIDAREKEIANIENNYVNTRKANSFSKDAGVASRNRVASTDVLTNSVDENGLIRTKQPGGAIDQYKEQTIDGAENVVRKNLARLGETINLDDVEKGLLKEVNSSGLEGADLTKAQNGVKQEVAGYKLKADKNNEVPLVLLQDAKINHYKNTNYLTPPEVGTYRKSVARGLKTLIQDNSSFNVEQVNDEISKYLQDVKLLERLDGKRVRGGKLGKYFAQISGNIVGGLAGGAIGGIPGSAVGTVVGGELGSRIKGSMLERALGGESGFVAPKNPIIEQAIKDSQLPKADVESRVVPLKPTAKPSRLPTIR